MKEKQNKQISQWLMLIGFFVLLSFICFLAYISISYINRLALLNDKAYRHPFSVSNNVQEIKRNIISMHRGMKDIVLIGEIEDISSLVIEIDEIEKETMMLYALVEERFLGDLSNITKAKNDFVHWKSIRDGVILLVRAKEIKKASEITRSEGAFYINKLNLQMEQLVHFAKNKALEFHTKSQQTHHEYEQNIWIWLIVIITLSFTLFLLVFYMRVKSDKSFIELHNKYYQFYQNSPDILLSFDLQKEVIINCNQTASQQLGYDKSTLLGMPIIKIINDNSIERVKNYLRSAQTTVLLNDVKLTLKTSLNEAIEVSVSSCGEYNDDNQIYHTKVFCRDIGADIELREKLKISASVFEYANQGICITDKDNIIIDVNNKYCEISGYQKNDVIGKNPRILKSGYHDTAFYQQLWERLLVNKYWRGEMWNKRKDGTLFPILSSISLITDERDSIKNHIAIFSDITDMKNHEKSLKELSYYDSLTNLPNRLLLKDRLKQAIARSSRNSKMLAILFIDLDGFKHVNDLDGHDEGDRILIKAAKEFKDELRKSDTLSRQGGDEFIAIISDLNDTKELTLILTRILEVAKNLHRETSASIGVTLYPQEIIDQNTLLSQADKAMYKAKERGKNQYCYYDELI